MMDLMFARFGKAVAGLLLLATPVFAAAQTAVGQQTTVNQAGSAPVAAPAPGVPTSSVLAAPGYKIGKGDVIEIGVVGRDDYRARVQVQEDGAVQLPLINSVPIVNRSALEVSKEIAARLQAGGYFLNPAINVTVVSFASRYVTVLGQVATPGVVAIDREYRLSEVIARAGGVTNPAINTITVTRANGQSQDYQLTAIATGGPDADPLITEGDKIYAANAKTFYIYGQVNAPGNYPIEPGMSVRMALARAGGLTALGSSKKVKLVRGEKERKASLAQPLAAGDVIVIGERFF